MKRCENTFNGFYFAQNNAFGLIWLIRLHFSRVIRVWQDKFVDKCNSFP